MKNNGPKIEPWGTPLTISYQSLHLATASATRIQLLDHFNWRLISQLIIDISHVLPKLLRYFNGNIILTSFVNDLLLLLSAQKLIIFSLLFRAGWSL